MEEESKKKDTYPKLLHLIPNEREWKSRNDKKITNNTKLLDEDERELELTLRPPGETEEEKIEQKPFIHALGYSLNALNRSSNFSHGAKRGFSGAFKSQSQVCNARIGKELSIGTSVEREKNTHQDTDATTKARATFQTRNAPVKVVGWPPVRSFRKNIASSSRQLPEPQNNSESNHRANLKKSNFVKINMEGIPIGRKVDLSAYDSYEKLCLAVKELFEGLLEVQKDSSNGEDGKNREHEDDKIFSCLLDGSGEYTLVYEDSEGGRVLASDVPWKLFVLSARRLRVLKSSELSRLLSGSVARRRTTHS